MAINKITLKESGASETVLIDLSRDEVTEKDVIYDKQFHKANGDTANGSMLEIRKSEYVELDNNPKYITLIDRSRDSETENYYLNKDSATNLAELTIPHDKVLDLLTIEAKDTVGNSGEVTTLANLGEITTLANSGTITALGNLGNIERLTNTGSLKIETIKTDGSNIWVNAFSGGSLTESQKIVEDGKWFPKKIESANTKYYGAVYADQGTITLNTTGGSSSGTINAGSQIKIGKGFYNNDVYYEAEAESTLTGNANPADVLSGKTFYSNSYTKQTGTMTNNGAISKSVNYGGSYTIPAGYHNGSGKVSCGVKAATTENITTATSTSYVPIINKAGYLPTTTYVKDLTIPKSNSLESLSATANTVPTTAITTLTLNDYRKIDSLNLNGNHTEITNLYGTGQIKTAQKYTLSSYTNNGTILNLVNDGRINNMTTNNTRYLIFRNGHHSKVSILNDPEIISDEYKYIWLCASTSATVWYVITGLANQYIFSGNTAISALATYTGYCLDECPSIIFLKNITIGSIRVILYASKSSENISDVSAITITVPARSVVMINIANDTGENDNTYIISQIKN